MRRRAVLQNAINQSTNQSINWPNDRSINRSISQSINWPIEQANKHPIDQSIDQPIEQSNNWSIDQPINQSFDQFLWRKNGMARPWKLWSSALSNSLLRLFHWGGFVEQCRGVWVASCSASYSCNCWMLSSGLGWDGIVPHSQVSVDVWVLVHGHSFIPMSLPCPPVTARWCSG